MDCLKINDIIAYQTSKQNLKHIQSIEHHLTICSECRKKVKDFENLQTFIKKDTTIRSTEECYDDFQLVEYIQAKNNRKTRKVYSNHLSRCDSCLHRLVNIENMLDELRHEGLIPKHIGFGEKFAEILDTGTTRIKDNLISIWDVFTSPKPAYRWLGICVVLLITTLVVWQSQKKEIPFTTRESKLENQIQLLSPKNRSVVKKSYPLEFEWSRNEKSTSYSFILLDTYGNIIWEKKTDQTKLKLPNDILLQPLMTYFWQVESFSDAGISIQSDLVNFTYNPN